MLTSLVSVPVTEDEIGALRLRRGYWLRRARERANMDQNSVAKAIGLSERSGTVILAWEKGRRSPDVDQLHQLARLYNVPMSLFTEPRETDAEWLAELAGAAIAAAVEDDDEEGEQNPGAGERPAESPHRRSA